MTLVSFFLQDAGLDALDENQRRMVRQEADRIVEETGASAEEALHRALESVRNKRPPFRRTGLRWDE